MANSNPFYHEKLAGFKERVDDLLIEPFIYQPTPQGVEYLCRHYSQKYNIDLRYVDLRGAIKDGASAREFFSYLPNYPELLSVEEGRMKGLVLGHGAHHAIPLLLHRHEGELSLVCFDSSSGCRIKGYFSIATLFPEAKFYLNSGTRQSDEGSCITDAICILKEALQINELQALIDEKKFEDHPSFHPGRFIKGPEKPENFFLFRMPERLLLTAQVSAYLEQAEANLETIIRGGESLRHYRQKFTIQVNVFKDDALVPASINSYLFVKSKEHKKILDAVHQKRVQISIDAMQVIGFYQTLSIETFRPITGDGPAPSELLSPRSTQRVLGSSSR